MDDFTYRSDPLRLARHHVIEGEKRVAAQQKLLARIMRGGGRRETIEIAQAVLWTFETMLDAMRNHLALEELRHERRSRRRVHLL